jgi:hypothetical protein
MCALTDAEPAARWRQFLQQQKEATSMRDAYLAVQALLSRAVDVHARRQALSSL